MEVRSRSCIRDPSLDPTIDSPPPPTPAIDMEASFLQGLPAGTLPLLPQGCPVQGSDARAAAPDGGCRSPEIPAPSSVLRQPILRWSPHSCPLRLPPKISSHHALHPRGTQDKTAAHCFGESHLLPLPSPLFCVHLPQPAHRGEPTASEQNLLS